MGALISVSQQACAGLHWDFISCSSLVHFVVILSHASDIKQQINLIPLG